MATPSVRASWRLPPRDDGSERPIDVTQAGSDASPMCGLMLANLPLELLRAPLTDDADTQVPCELSLEWDAQQPLRCQQLQLEIVSSARHVELFIEGVRRSLLGEDEHGEVYLGTFRGTKSQQQQSTAAANGSVPQLFTVSHEFLQRDAATDILKETQKLRVKFVSLTGDKNALHLQTLKCAFVRLAQQQQPPQVQAPSLAFAVPLQGSLSAADSMAAQLAGLGLGSAGNSSNGNGNGTAPPLALGGLDAQVIMQGFQQMLEREMESKILRAVDAKLAALSQRLAFSEQRLFQLHQQVDANGSDVKASLALLQQQVVQLESHVKQQLAGSVAKTPDSSAPEADTSEA